MFYRIDGSTVDYKIEKPNGALNIFSLYRSGNISNTSTRATPPFLFAYNIFTSSKRIVPAETPSRNGYILIVHSAEQEKIVLTKISQEIKQLQPNSQEKFITLLFESNLWTNISDTKNLTGIFAKLKTPQQAFLCKLIASHGNRLWGDDRSWIENLIVAINKLPTGEAKARVITELTMQWNDDSEPLYKKFFFGNNIAHCEALRTHPTALRLYCDITQYINRLERLLAKDFCFFSDPLYPLQYEAAKWLRDRLIQGPDFFSALLTQKAYISVIEGSHELKKLECDIFSINSSISVYRAFRWSSNNLPIADAEFFDNTPMAEIYEP